QNESRRRESQGPRMGRADVEVPKAAARRQARRKVAANGTNFQTRTIATERQKEEDRREKKGRRAPSWRWMLSVVQFLVLQNRMLAIDFIANSGLVRAVNGCLPDCRVDLSFAD